ncbi:MAG: thiamine pyrophosphate-binding protein [Chloroflexi bacterium]|nr:thiamine pyrophosphate-binding protein [Chloroflexota bacterium]
MIDMRDAMKAVIDHRRGDLVLTTETSTLAWQDVTDDDSLDLPIPAMSKGSSMALGVALAQPDRRVILWDGDGSLLMNLGSIVTVAGKAPKNFYHIILDNGIYAMTGGQPLPNAGGIDFEGLARSAGYPRTTSFDNLEDWVTGIGEVLEGDGPVMIVMTTTPELTDWKRNPPVQRRDLPESAPVTKATLAGQGGQLCQS